MSVSPVANKTIRSPGPSGKTSAVAASRARVAWVDYAKGICILLVVLMHSTLGVEKAAGETTWLHPFIEWARPFRMPDFFLIAGLFVSQRMDKPWRQYFDGKILHFVYFYTLWMTILYLAKDQVMNPAAGIEEFLTGWATLLVVPHDAIWFIYMLPVFMLALRLTRRVPTALLIAAAALLEAAPVNTGWLVADEFAARFVYILIGYKAAAVIFRFADWTGKQHTTLILTALAVWAVLNTAFVVSGLAVLPGVSFALGLLGAGAVVATGVLLSRFDIGEALRYCGEHSLTIYLAFTIFMAATRMVLLRTGLIADLAIVSLLCMLAGVIGPLLLLRIANRTAGDFLFHRPDWARMR